MVKRITEIVIINLISIIKCFYYKYDEITIKGID